MIHKSDIEKVMGKKTVLLQKFLLVNSSKLSLNGILWTGIVWVVKGLNLFPGKGLIEGIWIRNLPLVGFDISNLVFPLPKALERMRRV